MDARRVGWLCIILWWREGLNRVWSMRSPRKTDWGMGEGGYLIGLSD